MQYQTQYELTVCCFTRASPLTPQCITPDLLCEFGVIYIKVTELFLKQTNKQTNTHTHIQHYVINKKINSPHREENFLISALETLKK